MVVKEKEASVFLCDGFGVGILADAFRYLAVGWEDPFDADHSEPPKPAELHFIVFNYNRKR